MHRLLQWVTLAKWEGSVEAQYPDWSGALVSCKKVRTWPGRLRLASSCKGRVSRHVQTGRERLKTLFSQRTVLSAMCWHACPHLSLDAIGEWQRALVWPGPACLFSSSLRGCRSPAATSTFAVV